MKIRIKHILRCFQSGMSIRSISSSLLISRNTVKRYVRIYEDMGIEPGTPIENGRASFV